MAVSQDLKPYRVYEVPESHAHIAYNLLLGRSVVGASLLIRRDVMVSLGGYKECRKRGNDIEMISRLICTTRCANLPDSLYMYRRNDSQTYSAPKAKRDYAELMARLLIRLWGEAPRASLDRMLWVKRREKLSPLERRRARGDLLRFIDSMVAAGWIEQADRACLIDLMNRQLEWTTPRVWQMLLHWRRHHFGGENGHGDLS